VTARALYTEAIPYLLSRRAAGRLLGTDPSGRLMDELIATRRLRLVRFGSALRIPLEDVQAVAREGFVPGGRPSRKRADSRGATAPGVGARIRALEVKP
jgi:hypothetical protein